LGRAGADRTLRKRQRVEVKAGKRSRKNLEVSCKELENGVLKIKELVSCPAWG
jgi:hypothetical protein